MSKIKKIINIPKDYRNYKIAAEKFEALAKHYQAEYEEANHLQKLYKTWFEPGHFYSPYPDLKEVKKRKASLFDKSKRTIPGIDIREDSQLKLIDKLSTHYKTLPYTTKPNPELRYRFDNNAYSYTDAIMLFCMLKEIKPKKVIEIGSGYSSALMLDTNELFFDNKMKLTFVEPYPALLLSLTKPQDSKHFSLIKKNLSEVDAAEFRSLEAGDILFVDSTHVSKIGSDVNQIIFDILPNLKKGVIVHIHDVFYPFEYPMEWILQTRAWNEDYMLRAYLHNNKDYEILLFNDFLNTHHQQALDKLLPLTKANSGGSLWLKKVV